MDCAERPLKTITQLAQNPKISFSYPQIISALGIGHRTLSGLTGELTFWLTENRRFCELKIPVVPKCSDREGADSLLSIDLASMSLKSVLIEP